MFSITVDSAFFEIHGVDRIKPTIRSESHSSRRILHVYTTACIPDLTRLCRAATLQPHKQTSWSTPSGAPPFPSSLLTFFPFPRNKQHQQLKPSCLPHTPPPPLSPLSHSVPPPSNSPPQQNPSSPPVAPAHLISFENNLHQHHAW